MSFLEDERFAAIVSDYVHGASVLTRELLELLSALRGADEALQADLRRAEQLLRQTHPEMVSLAGAVKRVVEQVLEGRDAGDTAQELTVRWEANLRQVVALTADYLVSRQRILTISYSGLVRNAVLALKASGGSPRVYVGEGRPRCEGMIMGRELSAQGVTCTVFADAAFADFLGEVDTVLVGADAVGPELMLNKVGTRVMLREARAVGVPTAIAYDFLKLVSTEQFPQSLSLYPSAELVGNAQLPAGMRIVNRYFEYVQLDLVDAHLTASDGR